MIAQASGFGEKSATGNHQFLQIPAGFGGGTSPGGMNGGKAPLEQPLARVETCADHKVWLVTAQPTLATAKVSKKRIPENVLPHARYSGVG